MDGASNSPLLRPGMEFDVTIGDSFREDSTTEFYSLRHDFLPASVDTSTPAQLTIESDKVRLQYLDGAGSAEGTMFHGGVDVNKDGLDCALIFDGTNWRLEMVSGVANNLRSMRSPGRTPLMDHFPQTPNTRTSDDVARMDEGVGEPVLDPQDESPSKLPDHTSPGNEDLEINQDGLESFPTSHEAVQSASPEDRGLAGSNVDTIAAGSGGDNDNRKQKNDDRQSRKENDSYAAGSPGNAPEGIAHGGNSEGVRAGEVQPPANEINAAHSDRASSDPEADELEAALFNAMEGDNDSQSDAGESVEPLVQETSNILSAVPADVEGPSQTATPDMTCPPMSSSGRASSSSSSSSSDSGSGQMPNGVPDADTNGVQDVMVVENDMERDFFADDYMDEVPLAEPVVPQANGVPSSSSSSSSSSSGSGDSSSSSEEEATGEGPINEPEVDVF